MDVAAFRRFRHLPRKEYLLHQKNENRRTACPCQEKVGPHTFVSVCFHFTGARERRCGGAYGRKGDLTGPVRHRWRYPCNRLPRYRRNGSPHWRRLSGKRASGQRKEHEWRDRLSGNRGFGLNKEHLISFRNEKPEDCPWAVLRFFVSKGNQMFFVETKTSVAG